MRPSLVFLSMLLLVPALAGALYSLGLRYLVENIDQRRPELVAALEKYLQRPLQVEELQGNGRIRHPRLTARNLRIEDEHFLFTARELRLNISPWSSLLHLAPRLSRLDTRNCSLTLRLPYLMPSPDRGDFLRQSLSRLVSAIDALHIRDCRVSLQVPGKSAQEYELALVRIRRHRGYHEFALDAHTGQQSLHTQGRLEYRHDTLQKAAVYAQFPLAETLPTLHETGLLQLTGDLQFEDAHGSFWWHYRAGAPQALQAQLVAARARVPGRQDSVLLQDLKTELRAEVHDTSDWQVFFPRLQFLLAERDISLAGELQRNRGKWRAGIDAIALQDALHALQTFQLLPPPLLRAVDGLQPSAHLHELQIEAPLSGPGSSWQLRAQVEDLRFSPWRALPGGATLDGSLHMRGYEGEFAFQGEDFDFHLPALYPPRRYRQVSGILSWKQGDRQWLFDTQNLDILSTSGHFIEAQIGLTLPAPGAGSPEIDLLMYAPQLDFATALAHVPEVVLRPLPEWLYRQDHGGSVTEAQLRIRGPLRRELRSQLRIDLDTEFEGLSLQLPMSLQLQQVEGGARLANNKLQLQLLFANSLLGGQAWHEGTAEVRVEKSNFEIQLGSAGAAGTIRGDGQNIAAELEYLHLPQMQFTGWGGGGTVPVSTKIERLSLGGNPLGSELSFSLFKDGDHAGVRSLDGEYRGIGIIDGTLYWETERDLSHFEGVLSFCDLEELLEAYNCPDERQRRNNRMVANLVWPGGFTEFAIEKSVGELRANLNEGHFLQLGNVPAQKFFQLLNLDSLLRRLQPSISALSAEGMGYERIHGGIFLQNGVLQIEKEGLVVESNNGKFRLLGTLDMLQRRLDGELDVTLPVAQNLPWYSLLLGGTPAGAAALWVTNRIFEDQIEKVFTVSYRVQGTAESINFQIKE